jgi:hypothetical protein
VFNVGLSELLGIAFMVLVIAAVVRTISRWRRRDP